MAAGPTPTQVSTAFRKAMHKLVHTLTEKGITARYVAATRTTYPEVTIEGANAKRAYLKLLRASNGEACGVPYVIMHDNTIQSGFGSFNLIQKEISNA